MFIRLCAYLLLAGLVLPYLKKIKVQRFEGIFFGVDLITEFTIACLMYRTPEQIENAGWLGQLLVYGYGTAAILSVSAAFTFYSRYIDKASRFFLHCRDRAGNLNFTTSSDFILDFLSSTTSTKYFNILLQLAFFCIFYFFLRERLMGFCVKLKGEKI